MRNMRVNYAAVGGFVLVMLTALVVVVALLTGRTGTTDGYTTRFANVAGVKFGTKVTYEGYVVGQVEKIDPVRDGALTTFILTVEVRRGWGIPKDSTARITSSGLLSAVIVDIRGGTSPVMLAPGTEIASAGGGNLFDTLSNVAGEMSDLNQTALKPLLTTLTARINAAGDLLEKQAPDILANLLAISTDLAQKTPRVTANLDSASGVLAHRLATEDNAKRIESTLAALDKMTNGNQAAVDASIKDLRYSLQAVARNIDSVSYNLEGTARNLNEFSRQLRDNPAVLLQGHPAVEGGGQHK